MFSESDLEKKKKDETGEEDHMYLLLSLHELKEERYERNVCTKVINKYTLYIKYSFYFYYLFMYVNIRLFSCFFFQTTSTHSHLIRESEHFV